MHSRTKSICDSVRNYNFFLSSLVGFRRGLAAIQAAGTDGEKSIIEALKHQFRDATLLRCFRHLQQNIERHCKELNMPPTAIRSYCKEVFGWTGADGTYCEGLVDSRGEEDFHKKLQALQGTWDERERGVLGKDREPTFFDWFRREKAYDFCTGSLADQREAANTSVYEGLLNHRRLSNGRQADAERETVVMNLLGNGGRSARTVATQSVSERTYYRHKRLYYSIIFKQDGAD